MRTALLSALTWALVVPAVLAAPTPPVPSEAATPREQAIAQRAAADPSNAHPIIQARAVRPTPGKKRKSPPEKYFHESNFHPHYDGRFASKEVPYADRKVALVNLIKSYLNSMNEIGIQTWIMHGSLLGWWWNKHIMPWDTDLDVMVSENAMEHLASYYNMTIHHHRYDDGQQGRDYMLEINPHFRNASEADRYNRIDARWVDTKTGLFIDITTLHRNITAENEGKVGAMMSKDKHRYHVNDIFPLRETVFENVPCLVPFGYTDLLIEEYGPMSLIKRDYANHHFDQLTMEWLPVVNPKKENKIDDKADEAAKAAETKKQVELKKATDEKKNQEAEKKKHEEEEKRKHSEEEKNNVAAQPAVPLQENNKPAALQPSQAAAPSGPSPQAQPPAAPPVASHATAKSIPPPTSQQAPPAQQQASTPAH